MESAFKSYKVTYTWKGHGCSYNKQINVYNHKKNFLQNKIKKEVNVFAINEKNVLSLES